MLIALQVLAANYLTILILGLIFIFFLWDYLRPKLMKFFENILEEALKSSGDGAKGIASGISSRI